MSRVILAAVCFIAVGQCVIAGTLAYVVFNGPMQINSNVAGNINLGSNNYLGEERATKITIPDEIKVRIVSGDNTYRISGDVGVSIVRKVPIEVLGDVWTASKYPVSIKLDPRDTLLLNGRR